MPPVARNEKSKAAGLKRGSRRQAYHLTCSNCRTRKVKCDGAQPECGICKAYSQECHYDKSPPMSQVLAMAERIAQLERMAGIAHDNQSFAEAPNAMELSYEVPTPSAPRLVGSTDILDSSRFDTHQSPVETATSNSHHDTPHYPSTSAVADPITGQDETSAAADPPVNGVMPTMNEDQLQFWEAAGIRACATQLRLPAEKIEHLLKTHWTWVHVRQSSSNCWSSLRLTNRSLLPAYVHVHIEDTLYA